MWSYLETLSESSKSDIWDRQIHNWRWKLFKCNTVISMRDINISIWALKNGVKIPKKFKLQEILSITLAQKFHKNSWLHMKLFIIECKNWTLLSYLYASIFDKIQQDIIQEVSDIYIVLINMLNFKNSIWRLIRIRTLNFGFDGKHDKKRLKIPISNLYPELSVLTLSPISVNAYMPRILAKSVC